MTKLLHDVAQHDTPEQVQVPNNWNGLVLWAVGRFGGIIVATALCAAGLHQVYRDLQSTNERMMSLMETRAVTDAKRAETDLKLAEALNSLSRSVDDLKREASEAHRPK